MLVVIVVNFLLQGEGREEGGRVDREEGRWGRDGWMEKGRAREARWDGTGRRRGKDAT